MTPKVIGWVRWVEDGRDMVPYKTTDRRLVVYVDDRAAESDRDYMDVVDPITSTDIKDVIARFELAGVCRIDPKPRRPKPQTQKRRKASQKQRKASQRKRN